jgi:hypothetical protein
MIRHVNALAPMQWVMKAANAGARNPRVLFAGAFSVVLAFLGVLFVAGVLLGGAMGQQNAGAAASLDSSSLLMASIPLMLLAMFAPQLVIAGLAQLVHRIETGEKATVKDAFAGLRRDRILPLCGLVVIPLATVLLTLLIYRLFGGEAYIQDYTAAMQKIVSGQMIAMPEPAHPFAMFVATMALNWISYALQLFAPIQVMLGGRSARGALVDCVLAFARNLPAMLFAGLLGFIALMGVAVLMIMALLVSAVLVKFIPALGSLLAFVLLLALAVTGVLFWVSCGYYGWRAMFGADPESDPKTGIAV